MSLPASIEIAARLTLLVAGLLLPGSTLLRALRLPWSLAAAFTTSAVVLYAIVLVFAWTGAVISLTTLAAALTLFSLGLRLVPTRGPTAEISSSFAGFWRLGGWTPLYVLFWLVVAWRLGTQPLSGPDTTFRWSWLAEQMVALGTLDFYPPRSADDFLHYFWAESIPPEVATLHAWVYACGGSRHALWTTPVVGLQLLSLHEIVWRLGNRWGGEAVARRALLFAAACPLLTWSVTLGQETGLTALALAGVVWALAHSRDADGDRWVVLAGIFAAAAAGSREYGPVFPVAALAAAVWFGASRRQLGLLAATALPLTVAWTVRVWLLTGNPVYSLDVLGLFPTNQVFTAWNDTLRGPAGAWLFTAPTWLQLGRYFLLWAFPAVIGFAALMALVVQGLREARLMAIVVGVSVALWLLSVGYTAGGPFYSLRVLSPAFALLCMAGGYGLAFLPSRRPIPLLVAFGIAALLLEAQVKTLVLPENPYRVPPREWLASIRQTPIEAAQWDRDVLAHVQPLPDRARVVSDYVGAPRLFATIGTKVAPLWSPEVAFLFDESMPANEVARRWRASGFRYLVLLKVGPSAGFVQAHARWRAPYFSLKTVADTGKLIVLEATVQESVKR